MWRPDRRILVSVADTDALAQFLRARRELVHPADVGLPEDGRRRVVGLRREEVAMLQPLPAHQMVVLVEVAKHFSAGVCVLTLSAKSTGVVAAYRRCAREVDLPLSSGGAFKRGSLCIEARHERGVRDTR
jgi:hypothetical protein